MGKVYVPVNIRKRKEYVDGIGKLEVTYAAVAGGIGLVLGIIIYMIVHQFLVIIFTPIVIAVLTLASVRKNNMNQSFIDQILYYIEFTKSQKRYYYEYYNPYEKKVKHEEGSIRRKETNS